MDQEDPAITMLVINQCIDTLTALEPDILYLWLTCVEPMKILKLFTKLRNHPDINSLKSQNLVHSLHNFIRDKYLEGNMDPDMIIENKDMHLINAMIEWGFNDWNKSMLTAALSDSFPLVEFFFDRGATNLDHSMIGAILSRSLPMVEFFVSKGANDWNCYLVMASTRNCIPLVEYFISRGANDWNRAMIASVKAESLELVRIFVGRGADNLAKGLYTATKVRSLPLMQFFAREIARS